MKTKIEEVKKEDIDSIVKFHMGLSDYHKKIDPKYYKSGKEREDYLRRRLVKIFSKRRRNQKILLAKVGNKVVGFSTPEFINRIIIAARRKSERFTRHILIKSLEEKE